MMGDCAGHTTQALGFLKLLVLGYEFRLFRFSLLAIGDILNCSSKPHNLATGITYRFTSCLNPPSWPCITVQLQNDFVWLPRLHCLIHYGGQLCCTFRGVIFLVLFVFRWL